MAGSFYRRAFCLLTLAILWSLEPRSAWPNMAPPPIRTAPVEAGQLRVYINSFDERTRIVLPESLIGQSMSSPEKPMPAAGKAVQGAPSRSRYSTVIVGLSASAVLIAGGIITVLLRRRRERAAIALGVTILVGMGVIIGASKADIPVSSAKHPALSEDSRPSPGYSRNGYFLGLSYSAAVDVETYSDGKSIILYLDRELAAELHEFTRSAVPREKDFGFSGSGDFGEYGGLMDAQPRGQTAGDK